MGIKEDIRQENFPNNKLMAVVNVMYSHNWLRDLNQPIFKKHNILSQHYNILRIVRGKHPKTVSPGAIKDVMIDKGRDLTRLVDKLVKLGLLQRDLCEHNRRKMEISITTEGLELVSKVELATAEVFQTLSLNEEEALQLSNLLDKMRAR